MLINILTPTASCPLARGAADCIKDPLKVCMVPDFLAGSIKLTWVQKMALLADKATQANEPFFTMMHNDARITTEDILCMIAKAYEAKAAGKKYYWTVTYNPAAPKQNKDIVAIIDTEIYWKLGGHDPRFDFYYADIDFHKRALAKGYNEQLVTTPSAVHENGGSNSLKNDKTDYLKIVTEKDRQIFNMLWPASLM